MTVGPLNVAEPEVLRQTKRQAADRAVALQVHVFMRGAAPCLSTKTLSNPRPRLSMTGSLASPILIASPRPLLHFEPDFPGLSYDAPVPLKRRQRTIKRFMGESKLFSELLQRTILLPTPGRLAA